MVGVFIGGASDVFVEGGEAKSVAEFVSEDAEGVPVGGGDIGIAVEEGEGGRAGHFIGIDIDGVRDLWGPGAEVVDVAGGASLPKAEIAGVSGTGEDEGDIDVLGRRGVGEDAGPVADGFVDDVFFGGGPGLSAAVGEGGGDGEGVGEGGE